MSDERIQFDDKSARNKFIRENKDQYVIGQTSSGKFFAEKRELTEPQAARLGYSQPTRTKMAQSGRLVPTDVESKVGSPEQLKDYVMQQYAEGKINPAYSAKIERREDSPQSSTIKFYKTPGGRQASIEYSSYKDVVGTSDMPEGQTNFVYNIGVEYPEQEADVRKWAQEHGAMVRRAETSFQGSSGKVAAGSEANILLQVTSPTALPEDAGIDVRSVETVRRTRAEKTATDAVMGKKIYEKANPLEKRTLHVRTLLSPAGYEYAGAVVRERSDPLTRLVIDAVFPNVKSSEDVVKGDIKRRAVDQAAKKETLIMGQRVPDPNVEFFGIPITQESIISAVDNPVIAVETMFLGGALIGAAAATGVGARILGSAAGKVGGAALTAGYVAERGYAVYSLRAAGESTKALGTAVTAIAGLGAGIIGAKAQYSTTMRAKTQNVIKLDVGKIKGASVSTKANADIVSVRGGKAIQIPKGSDVSVGKFKITEGQLEGLRGETFSVTGKSGSGKVVTRIPSQVIGSGKSKIKVPEQFFKSSTKGGTLSPKLKIQWRKSADTSIGTGKGSHLIGPNKEVSLSQEIARIPGRTRSGDRVVIRKFSGISWGKSAKDYDFYLVEKGGRVLIAEQSLIGQKHRVKVDWVDISLSGKAGGTFRISPGKSQVFTKPGTATRPPTPPATMNIKTAPAVKTAKLVWAKNPVPSGSVKIKASLKPKSMDLRAGAPAIVRVGGMTAEQKSEGVVGTRNLKGALAPKIKRDMRITPKDMAVTVVHPISGQEISLSERQAVLAELEPVIDRIPNAPVTPAQTNIKPPIIVPSLGLMPYLKMGPSGAKLKKFGLGSLKNPVPDIEKVI